jgi:AraC-like DNA-binding protein
MQSSTTRRAVRSGMPADELLNGLPRLGEVWPDGDELAERVAEAPDARGRLAVLTDVVRERLVGATIPDPLVRAAVSDLRSPGTPIEHLSKRLGVSERTLRRRFDDNVGYSPRTLARILRLQRFLGLAAEGGDLARIAAEAGYSDQPHLTRECVRLAGLPAAALLASGAHPADERLTEV